MTSSDSDNSSVACSGVEVGFLKDVDSWKMNRCYFPSKLGQKPAWLNPEKLPSDEDLKCVFCGRQCIFLLQLYAPDESDKNAFHRTIFVFCCKNPECHKANSNKSFKVFRCQLTQINPYYQSEPPDYENHQFSRTCEAFATLCCVCGCKGLKVCSRCSTVHYCSKEHQILDWKRHKVMCGKSKSEDKIEEVESTVQNLLFPEKEIVIEDEEIHDDENDVNSNLLQNNETNNEDSAEKSLSPTELEQFVNHEGNDEEFLTFRKRISQYSEQVIRYDKGNDPLWCSSENKISPNDVPKCHCGSSRQFEFQVMPQLLNYLDIKSNVNDPSIDWGTLAIYTCSKNCSNEDQCYSKEYLHKQDFAS